MGKFMWIGIVLTAVGAVVLLINPITYTTEETLLEVGPVTATAEREESFAIPAAVGWVSLGGGATLLLIGLFQLVRNDVL